MAAFTIRQKNSIYHLDGHMSADANFALIDLTKPEIHLDFRNLASINSLGCRAFVDFVYSWGKAKVFYHNCSFVLLDAIQMLPVLIGPEGNEAKIVTMAIPYQCKGCAWKGPLMVNPATIAYDGAGLTFPNLPCVRCSIPLVVERSANDYSVLFDMGVLK